MLNQKIFRSPLILVLAAPFIMLRDLLLPGKAMFWGTPMLQFVPWWTQAWRTLQIGQIPLWNPMVGMGAPLLANYQSGLFYPPNWSYFLLAAIADIPGIAVGMGWMTAFHFAFAGWGMVMLVRRLGWPVLSQTVAGLAFGLSSYLIGRAQFLAMLSSLAWLPWVMLAAYNLIFSLNKKKATAKLALVIGMQLLAGHAQISWYTLILAAAWMIYWALQVYGWQEIYKPLINFAIAAGWGGALAAVQLFPTAEYLIQSQRASAVELNFATTYSFWPWRIITTFFPDLFGSPATGDFWGYATYWEDALYIGVLGILLA
ncbi:MAG: YfhO family protein, partial [Chloroflexota bacterium]